MPAMDFGEIFEVGGRELQKALGRIDVEETIALIRKYYRNRIEHFCERLYV